MSDHEQDRISLSAVEADLEDLREKVGMLTEILLLTLDAATQEPPFVSQAKHVLFNIRSELP